MNRSKRRDSGNRVTLTTLLLSSLLIIVKRQLTAGLLLVLSLVPALNLAGSYHTLCTVTYEICGENSGNDCCSTTSCCQPEVPKDDGCCLIVPEEKPFVAPETLLPPAAPFLAELPPVFEIPVHVPGSRVPDRFKNAPDPPPRSARLLMALIERHLI